MSQQSIARRSFLAGSSALAVMSIAGARAESPADEPVGALWRGLDLLDVNGRTFQIGDVRAPLTLIKLWANWCPACWGEMPSLKALTAAVGPQDIEVLLISHPEYWVRDQQAALSRGVPFRLATPSPSNARAVMQAALTESNGAYAVPRSLLFKKTQDAAVWVHRGAQDWAAANIVAQMRKGRSA